MKGCIRMDLELMKDMVLERLSYHEPTSYGDLWKSCDKTDDDVFDEAIVKLLDANIIERVVIEDPYKTFYEAGYIIKNASDIKV